MAKNDNYAFANTLRYKTEKETPFKVIKTKTKKKSK